MAERATRPRLLRTDPYLDSLQQLAVDVGRLHQRLDDVQSTQAETQVEMRDGFTRLQADINTRLAVRVLGAPLRVGRRVAMGVGAFGIGSAALLTAIQRLQELHWIH